MLFVKEVNDINEITELPSYSKVIINGLPGTGKTESVILRIKYLVENLDIDPNTELLVLSFTRNAVREVKNRVLKRLDRYYQDLNVLTFDKFAWRLLSSTNIKSPSHAKTFTSNINLARTLLSDGLIFRWGNYTHRLEEWSELKELKYLILDEVQDVNTHRAEFTYELLDFMNRTHNSKMGFFLLGDLNQEIFGYLGKKSHQTRFTTSSHFLKVLKEQYDIDEIYLNVDFDNNPRYKNLDAKVKKVIAHATKLISTRNFTRNLYKSQVNDLLPHTRKISNISDFIISISQYLKYDEKTALLFRINKYASAISLLLFKNNIKHHYLIDSNLYPPWIAKIFYDLYEMFEEREGDYFIPLKAFKTAWSDDFLSRTNLSWQYAWVFLTYLATGRVIKLHEIKYSSLLKNIRKNFDESKLEEYGYTRSGVVVTNFHKAKGREYDHVFINEFKYPYNHEEDLEEAARTMYVGITRAKKTCQLFDYKPYNYRPYNVKELIPAEINRYFTIREDFYTSVEPFSFTNGDYEAARKRQEFLWEKIVIGNPIKIKCYESNDKLGEILYEEEVIGNIGEKFDEILKRWLRKNYTIADQVLTGGYIVAVYSQIDTRFTRKIPIPFNDLKTWIGIKILGVLYIEN